MKLSKTRRSFTLKRALMAVIALVWAMNLQAQDVLWKENFGGNGLDQYLATVAVSDGIVAVGASSYKSFENGDWTGIPTKGGDHDAIIVKYNNNYNVVWKKNFGGGTSTGTGQADAFNGVTVVSDGIVVVGHSDESSFGTGDWAGVTKRGDRDAIIVKYDHSGNVVWKKNFGGSDCDMFLAVTTVPDGVVAVGTSWAGSFKNAGDWAGYSTNVGFSDAIIVKYDNHGNVVWKKHFGGIGNGAPDSGMDVYYAVTTVSDGIVAVGTSSDFGNGDWFGVAGKGGRDAIIVKYDYNGNVMWKKNFGGMNWDNYNAVTTVSDGIVAVGGSLSTSFGTGDWTGVVGKGCGDAIIVKYDNNGNVVWKKNFGGMDWNNYNAATTVLDGIVAVGYSTSSSFGTGDWTGVVGKGCEDAIIVKYDHSGNTVWKKNFGGSEEDMFYAVTTVSDGIVTVGYSIDGSFGNGDWTDFAGKGLGDAIIITIDNSVSVSDIYKNKDHILLYPNPTAGELRIKNSELEILNFELFDMYGKSVEIKYPSNKLEGWQPQADGVVFNISHLPAGIYLVKITTEQGIVTKKVVKQ